MRIEDGRIVIEPFELLEKMSKEDKISLINNLKLDEDIFQMFLEYFSDEENLNSFDYYSNKRENRLLFLEKIQKCFNKDIKNLNIIDDLKYILAGLYSTDAIYRHIYHDAPQHIRSYFESQECFKSKYDEINVSKSKKFIDKILELFK